MPSQVNHYILGNSLINHTGGPHTNVPHWVDYFSDAAGHGYAVNGSFGFLRQFAEADGAQSGWGFAGVNSAWKADDTAFEDVDFDVITIAPANFIQDQSPDANYHGDDISPLAATQEIVADLTTAQPGAEVFIYQGWADMAYFTDDLGAADSIIEEYYAYNQGAYLDWYDTLADGINDADPDANVTVLPVGSILSELLQEDGVLGDLSIADLYVDSAPHGTETLYYLAGMVQYTALYGEPVPTDIAPPEGIDPRVIARMDDINDVVVAELQDAGFDIVSTPESESQADETEPDDTAEAEPDQETDPTATPNPQPVPDSAPDSVAEPDTSPEDDTESTPDQSAEPDTPKTETETDHETDVTSSSKSKFFAALSGLMSKSEATAPMPEAQVPDEQDSPPDITPEPTPAKSDPTEQGQTSDESRAFSDLLEFLLANAVPPKEGETDDAPEAEEEDADFLF